MPTPTQKLNTTTEFKTERIVTHTKPDWIDSITLATPILTFLAGYFLNKLVEDYKENQRLNQVEKYYFSLVQNLVKAIDGQAKAIDETVEGLKVLKSGKLLIPRLPSMQTSRITTLPDIDLYKAFILRKKSVEENNKRLSIIAGCTDFITSAVAKIDEYNKDFADKNINFSKDSNETTRKILKVKNDILLEVQQIEQKGDKPSIEADFILERFTFHINNHQKYTGKTLLAEPIEIYNNFIEPLFEDIKTKNPIKETSEFVSLIDEAKADFLRFFAFRNGHVQRLESLAASLRTVSTAMGDAIRELKNQ